MQSLDTTRLLSRQAESRLPDLFDWAHQNELHTRATILAIARRAGVSPAVAALIAELAGLTTEARHG